MKRIGEILLDRGYITEAQLHDALADQKGSGKFLGTLLLERGVIDGVKLAEALAQQFNLQLIDVKSQHIDLDLARKFTTSLILDHKCFPLFEDETSFTIAIVNPLDDVALSKLEQEASPKSINFVMAVEEELAPVLQSYRQFISQNIQRLLKRKPIEGIGGP
ncbi:MAG: hypothetical protein ACM3OC_03705 [Deltaproteobacteria bacterium]